MFLTTILMVASISAYALNKVDGVYQIGTADDLNAFAELVNGGEVNANAVLTADIDKGTENYRIGCDGQDYQGTFDGNGHTITYNMTFDEDGASLFRNVGIQGIIQNLKVQGIINTNSSFAGSIAGWNRGRIIGCYADVTINSSKEGIANHGGLVGRCYFGAVIENCLVKVAIKGEKSQICGGVIGWTSDRINIMNTLVVSEGTILDNSNGYSCNIACCPSINPITVVTKNVYVVNPISNDYGRDGNKYTFYENEEGIANGELAFLLNGKQSGLNRFYQVIGTDPMPTPLMNEGGRIYVTAPEFRCDGLPLGNTTFSNTYTSDPVIPAHHFVEGWCTVCGNMDEDFVTPVNGWLEITNGAQLKWWSAYAFTHEDCKARLTADINMEGYCEGYTPPQIFTGQFDGQGHVISNFIIESSSDYQGLIGIIGNGAFIKNLVLDKTCSITGNAFCGVIGGTNGSGDIYIDRVGNEGTVATYNQNAAGILGIDMQGSMNLHITNCYVTGTIDGGRESGAICGYSNTNSEVINCWSTATIPQYSIYSSDSFTRGPAKVTNCYEAAIEGVDATKQQHINPIAEDRKVNPITLEEVANGSLCYKLNESRQGGENFYQVIGTDPIPLPFAKEGGKVYCQGNSVYSNTPPVDQEGTWTDANGTEWYFTTNEGNATITNRGFNNDYIPSISGTIPAELTIPSTVYIGETPYSVTSIGFYAFKDCSGLTSITIPGSVTSIGISAFYGCSSPTSITIPESVTSIGNGAFYYCSGLTSINIPKSVTFIEGDLFTGCDNLTSITVEEGNSVYDSRNGCNAIIKTASNTLISGCNKTFIPESVVSIGDIAFQSRYILTSITIPDGVISIGDHAFNCCDGLTSITIPNCVKTIRSCAFRLCGGLTSIVVNEGNTIYDSRNGCNAIIETASNTLISGCKNTIIPDGVTSIGIDAFSGSRLTSINIPKSVTSIGEGAFLFCTRLTSINIPEGITRIEPQTFYCCSSLTSITIPESVTAIDEGAFAGCSNLNTITVNAVTPPACAEEAFSNAANCTLKVPYGTGDAYAAADGWKNFNEIIECDPEGTDISQLDNAIYIEPFVAKVGENTQMEICLKNAEAATAYVFDLVLPEGITVATNDKGKYIDELSDRHDDHTRTINYKGENTYSLSTLSGNSEELTGNDGAIRLVTIAVSDNMAEGNYAIDIKNASYSKPDGTLVSLPDVRAVVTVEDYVLGDVNGNGGVDIGDAVSIVNYLVGKDSSNFVAKAADTNKNGQIDIGDAVTIVNLLVGKITSLTRELNIIWDDKNPE